MGVKHLLEPQKEKTNNDFLRVAFISTDVEKKPDVILNEQMLFLDFPCMLELQIIQTASLVQDSCKLYRTVCLKCVVVVVVVLVGGVEAA